MIVGRLSPTVTFVQEGATERRATRWTQRGLLHFDPQRTLAAVGVSFPGIRNDEIGEEVGQTRHAVVWILPLE